MVTCHPVMGSFYPREAPPVGGFGVVCAGSVQMGLLVKASSMLHSLLHPDITTAWFYRLRDLLWSCGQKVWHQHPHSLPEIYNEVLVHLT